MVQVYFESNTHAEWIATFENEELYILCLPKLKSMAESQGMTVTESVEAD